MSPCMSVLGKGFMVSEVQHQQQVRCECPFSLEDEDLLWARDYFDQMIINTSPYDVEKLVFTVTNVVDFIVTLRKVFHPCSLSVSSAWDTHSSCHSFSPPCWPDVWPLVMWVKSAEETHSLRSCWQHQWQQRVPAKSGTRRDWVHNGTREMLMHLKDNLALDTKPAVVAAQC